MRCSSSKVFRSIEEKLFVFKKLPIWLVFQQLVFPVPTLLHDSLSADMMKVFSSRQRLHPPDSQTISPREHFLIFEIKSGESSNKPLSTARSLEDASSVWKRRPPSCLQTRRSLWTRGRKSCRSVGTGRNTCSEISKIWHFFQSKINKRHSDYPQKIFRVKSILQKYFIERVLVIVIGILSSMLLKTWDGQHHLNETDGKADLRTRSGIASEILFYSKPLSICS